MPRVVMVRVGVESAAEKDTEEEKMRGGEDEKDQAAVWVCVGGGGDGARSSEGCAVENKEMFCRTRGLVVIERWVRKTWSQSIAST